MEEGTTREKDMISGGGGEIVRCVCVCVCFIIEGGCVCVCVCVCVCEAMILYTRTYKMQISITDKYPHQQFFM